MTACDDVNNHVRTTGLILPGVAVLAGLGWVVWRESDARERDYHAVVRETRRVENAIRSQMPAAWLLVEGHDQPGPTDPEVEAQHRAWLDDFDRLGHVEGFAMKDLTVRLEGDTAHVSYRVEGRPWDRQAPLPTRGELIFRRMPSGWELAGHHFVTTDTPTPQP